MVREARIEDKTGAAGIAADQAVPDVSSVALRREKLRLRNAMTQKQRALGSARITEQLIACSAWQEAENILIYASYGTEVSTRDAIERALGENKRVFCPKVEGERMAFYRIFSYSQLKPGFRNILEPEGLAGAFHGAGAGTLLIAPGTVFDPSGHRIGYGGGYYDRYLGSLLEKDRPFCIGICFFCQLAEQIMPREHDVSMDLVICG